ncbi:MAG: pyridoxal kinase PdxY [Alphaproteobacteria bacterium]|nr:pyridoxal kinase PdxY [Alphaproteobacteria bacterium]
MTVLAISSQVAYGHVGLSAGVFCLQRLGIETWPVPTVLFSNHPGHGGFKGRVLPAEEVAGLIEGVAERGLLAGCVGLLAGYMGSAANGQEAWGAILRLRAANPKAVVLVDPVFGDKSTGVYAAADLPDFFRQRLVPAADLITPNQFELERLTDRRIDSLDGALAASDRVRKWGPRTVVVTSFERADAAEDVVETLLVTGEGAWLLATPRIERVPHGAGDMFAALFLGYWLKHRGERWAFEQAVAATYGILRHTADLGLAEPALIEAQDEIVVPSHRFEAERVR